MREQRSGTTRQPSLIFAYSNGPNQTRMIFPLCTPKAAMLLGFAMVRAPTERSLTTNLGPFTSLPRYSDRKASRQAHERTAIDLSQRGYSDHRWAVSGQVGDHHAFGITRGEYVKVGNRIAAVLAQSHRIGIGCSAETGCRLCAQRQPNPRCGKEAKGMNASWPHLGWPRPKVSLNFSPHRHRFTALSTAAAHCDNFPAGTHEPM